MLLNEKSILGKSNLVNSGIFGDDMVLYHSMSKNYFVLTHSGAFTWEKMDGKKNIKQIALLISKYWQIDSEQALKDSINFLEGLKDFGLVEIKP